jgi:O-antigen/teichoic acid export membrane protein
MTATAQKSGAELGRLARGGALNLLAAGVTGIANLVLVVMVTRGFPPALAGIFFAATTVFLLAARIAELGTSTGLVYFVARFRALGEQHRIRAVFRVAYPVVLTAAVLAGLVLFMFAPTWAELAVAGDPGPFTTLVRILAVFVPLAVVAETCLAATRGYGKMRPTALVEKVARPLAQLALIAVAIAVGTGEALTLAWVAPYAGTAIAAWWFLRRTSAVQMRPQGSHLNRKMAREFWRFTAPRALTGVVQLALQRFDIVLVAALRGPTDAAIYAAATRFLVIGQMVNQALTHVVEPKLSELLGRDDHHASRTVYQTSTCWIVLLNWPFYLSFAVCAPLVLQLFGPVYQQGEPAVLVLTAAMLVASGCGMVQTVLNMAGRTAWNLGNAVLALTLNVTIDLLLIPHLGIVGAAIGWATAILTVNLLALAQVGRSLRLHPLGAGTRLAMVLAVACFGLIPLAGRLTAGDGWLPLVASLVAGIAVYLGLCWKFRRRLDLDALLALRRRTRTGGAA